MRSSPDVISGCQHRPASRLWCRPALQTGPVLQAFYRFGPFDVDPEHPRRLVPADRGDAPPLFLLSGLGSTMIAWGTPLLRALATSHEVRGLVHPRRLQRAVDGAFRQRRRPELAASREAHALWPAQELQGILSAASLHVIADAPWLSCHNACGCAPWSRAAHPAPPLSTAW